MRRKAYREAVLADRKDVLIENPELYKSKWKTLLKADKLHVEIGSGKGDYWFKMAELYPQDGWLAIERNLDVTAIALKKLPEVMLPNARFIALDGKDLRLWFAEAEIDVLHLNFVDPWPKNAHAGRRLTHPDFLAIYRRVLNKDGLVIMKSDNKELMEYSRLCLRQCDFTVLASSDDYRQSAHAEDVISEYEQKFCDLGQPIYRTVWQVNK